MLSNISYIPSLSIYLNNLNITKNIQGITQGPVAAEVCITRNITSPPGLDTEKTMLRVM